MGPPVDSLTQLEQIIHRQPEHISWSEVKQTTLIKGQTGLGIKIHTTQGQTESSTLITKVKDECKIKEGTLHRFDRIVAINAINITHESEEAVYQCLKNIDLTEIVLSVCSPTWSIPRIVPSESSSSSLSSERRGVASLSLTKSINKYQYSGSSEQFSVSSECNRFSSEESGSKFEDYQKEKFDDNQNELLRSDRFWTHKRSDITAGESECCSIDSDLIKRIITDRRKGKVLETEVEVNPVSPNFKRGISQVSKNSSDKSVSGSCSMFLNRRTDRKSKGEGKVSKKFIKTGSRESPDQEDMEPLHLSDFHVEGKGHPYHPSLSGPMKDTAVSMADIVIDPDHAHSQIVDDLRPSPSPSQLTSCQCATCQSDPTMCVHCGVKPSPGGGRKTQNLPAVSFKEIPSGQMPEEYRTFLLKKPHLAVWDGKNTHVVEIDKGSAREFGFSYKIKVGKNQDTSVEIYTLVESVVKGGPAKEKLYVGDWIRSINSTPIQTPADAQLLIRNSSKESILRLVIQRPVGLSQQPSRLRTDKPDKFSDYKPPSPQPQNISPVARDNDPLLPSTPIPGIIEPKSEPQAKITPQNIYFHNTPPTSTEDLECTSPPFPKAVKLPKVRIFICGGEAEKCARILLRDSDIDLEFKCSGYACADCSMATDCFGNVVMSVPCSNLYSTSSQTGSYMSDGCKGGLDSRCRNCGSHSFPERSPVALGTVVNVELFVVPEDRLFHHCCNYLFTKSSIFILTFDGAKLLGSTPGEFARLQNLSHTIRSFVGEEAHIMSCGLLNQAADQKNFIDEVRALFYTPYNTQLQNFNVCGPELINLCKNVSSLEKFNENQHLKVTLWKVITETIQRQRVLHPLLLIIDNLNVFRKKDMFVTESKLMEMIRQKLPKFELDVHQMVLTDLIMNGEILLGKAMPFIMSRHRSIDSLILLDPRLLMDRLHHAITTISEDKQIWNRTHSTGFIRATMFADLFPETGSHKQSVMSFMECSGLVFKKGTQQGAGDNLGQDLFIPYFALLPSSSVSPVLDKKDLVLYLRFSEHQGNQLYWQLVLSLAEQCDTPGSFSMVDVYSCTFMHAGLLVTASHLKIDDQVKFVFKREDKNSTFKAPELLEWMWSACHRALDSVEVAFHLGAPCPYGDECRRGQAQGLHLVDVRVNKGQQFCGEDRIDHIKTIRIWRTKDTESINLPPVRSPNSPSPSMIPVKSSPAPKQPVKVMEMSWSVFSKICQKLMIINPLGRDWQGLAGLMGYTFEDVRVYETISNPPKQLLCDWSCTNNATIDDLIELLLELERKDIVSDIRQHYPAPTTNHNIENNVIKSPSQQHKVSETLELEHIPNSAQVNQENKILNTHSVQGVKHGPSIQGVTITNVVSTGVQYSEEDNCVTGLGQSLIHNSQDQTTHLGAVDSITPVETIYQRSNSSQDQAMHMGTAGSITPVDIIYQRSNSIQET